MYKGLALLTGIFVAIMLSFNGLLAGLLGSYFSSFVYHLTGFIIILIIYVFKRKNKLNVKDLSLIFFLPGFLSAILVLFNNISINQIGITLTIAVSLFGQLIMSGLVDNFGLFKMPVIKFKKKKLFGYSVMLFGIIFMILL